MYFEKVLLFSFLIFGNSATSENDKTLQDCIETLLDIQKASPLTTNCCLMRLCPNNSVYRKMQDLTLTANLENQCDKLRNQLGCSFEKFKKRDASCTSGPLREKECEKYTDRTSNDKKIRLENITEVNAARNSTLQFLDVPSGDEMRVHDLRLEEKYLLFEIFSALMSYLQPDYFPSELIREWLQKSFPADIITFQLLRTEILVVLWLVFWAVVSVCLPFILIAHLCCPPPNIHRLNEDGSEVSLNFEDRCRERTLGFLLHLLLVLLLVPIITILAANEQISRYMEEATPTTNLILKDLDTFITNTHMQITFVATSSTDITIETVRKDLDDVEELLGKSYRDELAVETGIDTALNALDDVKTDTAKVTEVLLDLIGDCASARVAGNILHEKLQVIARELTIVRQQCRLKDRALCYTLQNSGFEVAFSCQNFTGDWRIQHLENIAKEKNFNNSIENARIIFHKIPSRVAQETFNHITDIKNILSKRRTELYRSAHSLDALARSLSESVRSTKGEASRLVQGIAEWDFWRWITVLGICTALSLLWGMLLCGAPCGCGLTSKTIPFLLSGAVLSCLLSLVVWGLGALSFLVGGHGITLFCKPFYEHPHFTILSDLFDDGGVFYPNGGLLDKLNKANDTLKLQSILKSCERNYAAYGAFHLHNLFDVKSVVNYRTWPDLQESLQNLSIQGPLEILTPSLQLNLQVLSTISTINLTEHRTKISMPVTKRDLNSFADQLNTVARQLTDLASAEQIDNLALMVRKIVHNEMRRLNELRDRILYKITALEVLIHPLNQLANQSLGHLRTIQYFLDHEASKVAEKSVKKFRTRLENYLEILYTLTNNKITKDIGKCRPLWDIFHSFRFYVCKLLMDPVNAISLSCFCIIFLLVITVPVVVKLLEHYKSLNEDLLTSITHRRTRDGLLIDNEGTWATPSSETPPDLELQDINQEHWGSPRQPSELLIPAPPPRPLSSLSSRITSPRSQPTASAAPRAGPSKRSPKRLSAITSRIQAARIPQISSISRARSPRRRKNHESLRLIDPIRWKTGSTTPKSWI